MQFSSRKWIFECAVVLAALSYIIPVEIAVHDCFPLHIEQCVSTELHQVKCFFLHQKTPDNLVIYLSCPNAGNIEVLNAKYSMPELPSLICSEEDKSLDCNNNNNNTCQCCTVPDRVCSVDSNKILDELSKTCNNLTKCSASVAMYQFKKTNCPSFTWPTYGLNCDNTPSHCYSRWIDVTYICSIPDDQTSSKDNDAHLTSPLSLGSKPTDLPIPDDDNWANFLVNLTFPCDGSINHVLYNRSIRTVPLYLGIWCKTPEGNLLLKHKVMLQSDTLGLVNEICEPALEVVSGDFVGIHHTIENQQGVIPYKNNQDSQLYDTLVVKVFDKDIMVGKELTLSGRKTKIVNKAFDIDLQSGFQTFDCLTTTSYKNTTNINSAIGVITGVTIAIGVVIAITILTVIFVKKVRKMSVVAELENEIYLDTSVIKPYYQSTGREVEVRENDGYLPPLKHPVEHHPPSHVYDEIGGSEPAKNRTTLQNEDTVQGTSSQPKVQSKDQKSKDPKQYVSVLVKYLTGVKYTEKSGLIEVVSQNIEGSSDTIEESSLIIESRVGTTAESSPNPDSRVGTIKESSLNLDGIFGTIQ